MLYRSDSPASRVVEMRKAGELREREFTITREARTPLTYKLAALRAEMDGLVLRLGREWGVASQAAIRAEQISHAIQRLEWVLERESGNPAAI